MQTAKFFEKIVTRGNTMRYAKKICVQPNSSIIEALEVINDDVLQIALVTNDSGQLLGTITDGDIRRAILNNISLDAPVQRIMSKNPVSISLKSTPKDALLLMQSKGVQQIPVLDESGVVVGIYVLNDLIASKPKPNIVVIMAGGLGTRLRPLTEEIPKPMLRVGDKPILEIIIEQLRDHGLRNIVLAVNYLAEQIEKYFEDGQRFGVNIDYIREKNQMGTAGSLSLLKKLPDEPLLVMNGDILTKIDFSQLISFHKMKKNAVTMCVRNYEFQIPYGVVTTDEDYKVVSIIEKPLHSFLVSAGIYVINPWIVELIPRDTYFDMPSLIEKAKNLSGGVGCFPVHDYWIDIGEHGEYKKANVDYGRFFKGDKA